MNTLSLVVPVLGSQDLLARLLGHLGTLATAAEGCGWHLEEAIVVDDGSVPPLTLEMPSAAVPCVVRLLRNERNMGKGFSVRRGALAANGRYVLMSDVDESAPLGEFSKLAAAMEPGVAIACGTRAKDDERPFFRRLLSKVFRMLARPPVSDVQCGFKLFDMDLMRPVFEAQRTNRFAFDVELVRAAAALGRASGSRTVVDAPVEWHGGRRSSLCVIRDAPRMLLDLFMITIRPLPGVAR